MYTVPVIPPDLRHEETIIQAASALDCLQSTITNIFDRIDKRISKNNAKINELSSRANSAALKIQNLSGTNKAIRIFSPAKFPSSYVFRDIELTFKDSETETAINGLKDYEITSRVDPVPSNIQEKLVFFHFRSAKNKSTVARVSGHRGLGDIPPNLKSVNSILLFSTTENVYGARKLVDEMNSAQRSRKGVRKIEGGTNRGPHIEPAPLSLSNRQKGTEKRVQSGLFYTPRLIEAPEIDLPVDLPDLPGIADDIQFDNVDNHQIAPSLFIDNLTDLPEIEENVKEKGQGTDSSKAPEKAAMCPPTAVTSVPPPPPPPPPPVSVVVSNKAAVAPPPPPPPPPLSPTESSVVVKKDTKQVAVSAPTDVHSNLMDAIRKAGGARGGRLRAAADVATQESSDKVNTTPTQPKSTGGDFMADLHNKLLMRRKGISGAKDGETLSPDNGNVISRLSALIPPPPQRTQNSSSDDDEAADDTDWAD